MGEQYDVRGAIEAFGGPAALADQARERGYKLSRKGVQKWRERGSIPFIWLMRLSQMTRQDGRNFHFHDFMKTEENGD